MIRRLPIPRLASERRESACRIGERTYHEKTDGCTGCRMRTIGMFSAFRMRNEQEIGVGERIGRFKFGTRAVSGVC